METTRDELREEMFALVSKSSGGSLETEDTFEADTEFPDTGMTSISYLELVDGVEAQYGVVIDLESDGPSLTSVDKFVDFLLEQGKSA